MSLYLYFSFNPLSPHSHYILCFSQWSLVSKRYLETYYIFSIVLGGRDTVMGSIEFSPAFHEWDEFHKRVRIGKCILKCGFGSDIIVTWDLVKNADSWVSLQTCCPSELSR